MLLAFDIPVEGLLGGASPDPIGGVGTPDGGPAAASGPSEAVLGGPFAVGGPVSPGVPVLLGGPLPIGREVGKEGKLVLGVKLLPRPPIGPFGGGGVAFASACMEFGSFLLTHFFKF